MEWEGFPFYYGSGSDRKGAVKAEWDDSALLQILTDRETDTDTDTVTDIETDTGQKYLKCTTSNDTETETGRAKSIESR